MINDVSDNEKISEVKEVFLFELDGEFYAVAVNKVDRVMKIPPITPIPNAPRAIVGIFHLQAKVVVVIDLIRRMEMEKKKPLTANFLFTIRHAKDLFAILIDKPMMMIRVSIDEIQTPNPIIAAHVPPQYVSGVFMFHEKQKTKSKDEMMVSQIGIENLEEFGVERPPRPVILLDLEKLLSQEDLMRVFTSQE